MKIIFLSDTHLGFDYPLRPGSTRERRGQSFYDNFERVLDYAKQNRADLVLHGGDFFFRSKLNNIVIDKAYMILEDFQKSGIPIMIIPGNHERSNLPDSFIINYPNIHIFQEFGEITILQADQKFRIIGLPYQKNIRDNFSHLIEQIDFTEDRFDILLMHQAIYGCTVGPQNYTFRYGEEVTKLADFPEGLDLILSGHIHRKQMLQCPKRDKSIPIIFSGSTQRTSTQENVETKGFYEIEISKDKKIKNKFLELPADMVERYDPKKGKSVK